VANARSPLCLDGKECKITGSKRCEGNDFCKIRWSEVIDGLEYQDQNFELDSVSYILKPMQQGKNGSIVFIFSCAGQKSSGRILD